MPEYIEREAVNNILLTQKKIDRSRAYGEHECDLISFTYENARQLVNAVPAADVVEVKHGENLTKMNPVDEFICSECGLMLCDITEFRIDEDDEDECFFEFEVKFCPNCGVKIKE